MSCLYCSRLLKTVLKYNLIHLTENTNGLFGSLEREESRRGVEGRRVEGNGSPSPCLDVLKLVRGKGVISHFPCLDVLKIRMERRGND